MRKTIHRCFFRTFSLFLACCLLILPLCVMDLALGTEAAATPGVVPNGFYYLKSYYGKYMTVHNGLDADGTNIYEYSANLITSQTLLTTRAQPGDCVFAV